jgi:hypothetical protein
VLEGASRTLASGHVSAVIIELNGSGKEFGHSNKEIHEKLLGFGFTPIAYAPKTRTLIKLDGYNTGNLNTIYVRDVDLIAERCKSAPKHVVHTAFGMEI